MILVTGASGLLGVSVVSLAQEQGREVVGIYHRHPVGIEGAKLLAANLADEDQILRIFKEFRPSAVLHCAAATDVDWCENHPDEAYRINVTVPSAIAGIASRTHAQLLYISTDAVFDGARGNYSESDTPAPVNVYASTKLLGEKEVLRQIPAAAIARVNLYGWNAQNKNSLAEWILKQLTDGKIVPGFSDVSFCPMLANDLAEILLAMLDRKLSGLYHVVGSEAITKYEFARRVASAFSFDPEQVVAARMVDANLKAPRPRNTSLNTEKISTALIHSMPSVDAGLRKFVELRESGFADRIKSHLTGVPE